MNKRKIPKVWLFIAIILMCCLLFLFMLFDTDSIYSVDISGFDNITTELKRPISVEQVMRSVEQSYEVGGTLDASGVVPGVPGGTPQQVTTTSVTTNGNGQLVKRIYSFNLYSGPTQSGSGNFVNVRPAYDSYNASYNTWWTTCYNDTSRPSSTLRSRAQGTHVSDGVMIDGSSRPLVAVGPAIMNQSRAKGSRETPTASEMRYGSIIDVVLEDSSGTYYMPAVVVDCKAHTYPDWVVQSGYAAKGGDLYYTAPGHKDNYTTPSQYDKKLANAYTHACVEFTASDSNLSVLSGYSIKGIIVY